MYFVYMLNNSKNEHEMTRCPCRSRMLFVQFGSFKILQVQFWGWQQTSRRQCHHIANTTGYRTNYCVVMHDKLNI